MIKSSALRLRRSLPYRFKAGETVPDNIRRIVSEEVDSAVDGLRAANSKTRDVAIHEARKSIKKLRGVLKLIRPELGPRYRAENKALRSIGRKLSELRDATAIIETFDGTIEKHHGRPQKDNLSAIRKGLALDKQEKEHSQDVAKLMDRSAHALEAFRDRAAEWPLRRDGFRAIAGGLETIYRRGRKQMRRAEESGHPVLYHEWRKRAKDHWYHVRLLENLWSETMKAREDSLHNLETWLGEDHNLLVLEDQLKNRPKRYGHSKGVILFTTLAHKQQRQLRADSLSLGKRLYEEKPQQFTAAIYKLWNAWQQQAVGREKAPQESPPIHKPRPHSSAKKAIPQRMLKGT